MFLMGEMRILLPNYTSSVTPTTYERHIDFLWPFTISAPFIELPIEPRYLLCHPGSVLLLATKMQFCQTFRYSTLRIKIAL